MKKDDTLWIKPTHTNPVFYRPVNGKTSPLTKDIEQELKDGDQIGLLPTSFFFRVSFSTDMNGNKNQVGFGDTHLLWLIDLVSRMSLIRLIPIQNHVNSQLGWQDQKLHRRVIVLR